MIASPPGDIRNRVLTRLLEKHAPAKTRNKPLSQLRAEVLRSAEQLLEDDDIEATERSTLLNEILSELPHLSVLEELFRDETVNEFMILSHEGIIRRTADGWLPTDVQFRDATHCRDTLKKLLQTATPIGDVPTTSDGGADGMLPNGFRMIAILPPRVLGLSPTAVFRRAPEEIPPAPPPSGLTGSRVGRASSISTVASNVRQPDPWERLRQRITERLIERLAANNVYDLSQLPVVELRKFITLYVTEFNEQEHLNLDESGQERLTLEILTGMKRS